MSLRKAAWSIPFSLVTVFIGGVSEAAGPDDQVAKASADFQQAAYEFALHLAVGEPGALPKAMQQTMRQLTVLRSRACPPRLRQAVDNATHNLGDGLDKRLDVIEVELKTLAQKIDVAQAQQHLSAARNAAKAKQLDKVQPECSAIVDSVVGQIVGIPLEEWGNGIRRARQLIGGNPSRDRMTEALNVLRGLDGVERFRPKAFQDTLQLAYDHIASAIELYDEGDFRIAGEQLRGAELPLKLAGRASHNDEIAQRLTAMWEQLQQAHELIVNDVNLARTERTEGFRRLEQAESEISRLVAQGI